MNVVGGGIVATREHLSRLDEQYNTPEIQSRSSWQINDLTAYLSPLFGRSPLRPLLDALALNLPAIATQSPLTREYLRDSRIPTCSPSNPMALAHHLIAWDHTPDRLRAESEYTGELIRTHHSPEKLLPRWESMLDSISNRQG